MKKFILALLLCCFLLLSFTEFAHADDEGNSINLQDVPKNLASALGISEYAGKLLACIAVIFWILLPTIIFAHKSEHILFVFILEGFLCLGFFIAVGWLDYWYMIMYVITIVGLWAGKMRGVFGGGKD